MNSKSDHVHKKTIDGENYSMWRMSAEKGFEIQLQLITVFGPALTAIMEESDDAMALALAASVKNLDVQKTKELTVILLGEAMDKNNDHLTFNHFDSKPILSLYKVVAWVLEVNFKAFFGEGVVQSLVSKATDKLAPKSEKPKNLPQT